LSDIVFGQRSIVAIEDAELMQSNWKRHFSTLEMHL
jgi:hypothetical protein